MPKPVREPMLIRPHILVLFVSSLPLLFRDHSLLHDSNCYPDGRDVMRKTGMLKFLKPGEAVDYHVDIKLYQK